MSQRSSKLWAKHLAGQSTASKSVDPRLLLKKTPYDGRILGVDPSLRGTGLAVLECAGSSYKLLHSETIRLKPKVSPIECLGLIHQAVANLIDLWKPRHLSCEETITFKTSKLLKSYAARGAALSAAAIRDIPVFEYAPLRVKQAVVGFGRASKEQMAQTLAQMLGLPEALPFDESDGLGLALCHALTWQPA